MPITDILNPNADPYLKQQIGVAEAHLKRLRDAGMNDYADSYEQGITGIIMAATGDPRRDAPLEQTLFATLKDLGGMAKGAEPIEKKDVAIRIAPDNAAESISELLGIADASGYRVNQAQMNILANSVSKGDFDKANRIAESIQKSLAKFEEQAIEEEKIDVKMNDGQTYLRGKKTGGLWTADGTRVTDGPVNTNMFAQRIAELTGGATQIQDVSGVKDMIPEGASFNMDDQISAQRKLKAIQEARALYSQGMNKEAADLLNAYSVNGMFGAVTPETLQSVLGAVDNQDVIPQPPSPVQNNKIPLSERLDQILTPR